MDKWLSHPNALKIISVLVALLLWAVVHFDQDAPPATVTSSTDTKLFEALPIRAEGLDDEKYALVAMEPTVVRMVVEGRRSDLLTATDSDYQIKADLTGLGPGEHVLTLEEKLPKGVQVIEMSPRTVKVEIEEIQTKEFNIQVVTNGTPANGYIAGTPTISPGNAVQVTLPKDEMQFVGAVTVGVDIDGATKNVTEKKAQVVVYDTEGKEMTDAYVSPGTVEVEVPITPPSKELPLTIGYSGKLPEGVSINSLYATENQIRVYADQKSLDAMDSYQGVVVDLSKLKESGSMDVKIRLGDGVIKTEPSEVTVNYKVDQAQTKTLNSIPIEKSGLENGLKAEWKDPPGGTMDINVSGSSEAISGLQAGQVKLTADLKGLGVGTHQVEVAVTLPDFVYLEEKEPITATVVISDSQAAGSPSPNGEGTPPPAEGGATGDTGGGEDSSGVFNPGEGDQGTDDPGTDPDAGAGNGSGSGTESGDANNAGSNKNG